MVPGSQRNVTSETTVRSSATLGESFSSDHAGTLATVDGFDAEPRVADDAGAHREDRDEADPLEGVAHAVAPVGLGRSDFHRDEVEERERGDLDPGDERGDTGRRPVLERHQEHRGQNGEQAREVRRLREGLDEAGGRVDAKVVEDHEVEDQEGQK